MFNRLIKSLCRECGKQKRNAVDCWCPKCLAERDQYIELYISAALALPRGISDQDKIDELVNIAIADLRARPAGSVIQALRDTIQQVRQICQKF